MIRPRLVVCSLVLATVFLSAVSGVSAQGVVDQLRSQIQDHNSEITKLQSEIAEYQKQLDVLGGKRSTLESTIQTLEISRKKLSADISITQNKIAGANLRIRELSLAIGSKEETISDHRIVIAQSLRTLAMEDQTPLIEQLVASERLADAWEAADTAASFKRALGSRIQELLQVKDQLSENRDEVSATKKELVTFQSDLVSQRGAVEANKVAQQSLLKQTKNQESTYQQLVAKKIAEQKAFEDELLRLQNELDITIDPSRIPSTGKGVLSFPFSATILASCKTRNKVFGNIYCVAQYFGNTAFATANPQIYSGRGHNGIDIDVPTGTPIRSALSGIVMGTGNSDLTPACYSYGKWILIKHANGLSTLYAHLSTIGVKEGQSLLTGEVIGYTGMTGYSTGPHLHFTVIASQGIKIMKLGEYRGTKTPCSNAVLPLAPPEAYLNPLSYL